MGKNKYSKGLGFIHIPHSTVSHSMDIYLTRDMDTTKTKPSQENLSKSMNGKDMGIPKYFPWIGYKYSHTLGNLWKLVFDIWEPCGFLNSIDFYPDPIAWEYISFPQTIPIAWNFTFIDTIWIIWVS